MVATNRANRPSQKRMSTLGGIMLVAVICGIGFWAGTSSRPSGEPEPTEPETLLPPKARSGAAWFREMTTESGLDFTYRNGEEAKLRTILESLGGGVALIDYDGDGLLDVFVTGGGYFERSGPFQIKGHPCRLFRNLGNFKFEDVSAKAGLDQLPLWYTHGAAVADYDCDGWPDLLVTGYGRVVLLHNEPDGSGGRKFVDVTTSVGLKDDSWSTSAGWGDIDGDGFPDLYICHYCDWSASNNPTCRAMISRPQQDVCPPERFNPLVHALFKNEGGKHFRNVSAEQGFKAEGNGLGVVLLDVNDDGRPDIYVANDATPKFLFMNRKGRLEEIGLAAGVALEDTGRTNGSMGIDAGDYDGSGRPSLWVSNFQGEFHALYQNLGGEHFRYAAKEVGMIALGKQLVGFGTGFLDADNDGWEDLVIAHGHVLYYPPYDCPFKQLPLLLLNVADRQQHRRFENIKSVAGPYFCVPRLGRGLAIGDLDNDGWPDLVVSHSNSPVAVLRNVVGEDSPAKWIGIRLVGRGHRDVVGSTVILDTGVRELRRYAKGGGSYLSANDPRLLFGLGSEGTIKSVTVKWSWGETQIFTHVEPGSYWELHEGLATPVRIVRKK